MATRDSNILRDNAKACEDAEELRILTRTISEHRARQKVLIRRLLKAGITTRLVGSFSGMSHQTVARIRDER